MATGNQAAWQAMSSKLKEMGGVSRVVIGEPRTGIQSGLVAIVPDSGEVDETTLSHAREIHRVIIRMYRGWTEQPQENIEFALDQFRADIEADFFGDFTLGGTIAYKVPREFAWQYDEDQVQNQQWRIIDIAIGYRIDDRAAFAP